MKKIERTFEKFINFVQRNEFSLFFYAKNPIKNASYIMESDKEVMQGIYKPNFPLNFHKYAQNLIKMTIYYIAS